MIFQSAQLKLTAYYIAIIVIITSLLSFFYYLRVSAVIEREFHGLEKNIIQEYRPLFRNNPEILQELRDTNIRRAKQDLKLQLMLINFGILGLSGIASYFLASKTLQPIESMVKEQKQFISDAAHELNTPITAMQTAIEVSLEERLSTNKARLILKENLQDLQHLSSLATKLLRLSRLSSEEIELKKVDIQQVFSKVEKIFLPLARKSKVKLHVNLPQEQLFVKGDEDLVRELFSIFVQNAIKYNRKNGSVIVKGEEKSRHVVVSFEDNGVGIDKHHLPYIFKRFYRVDASRTIDGTNGHGLGLSIAQRIVTILSGSIDIKSARDKGSTFYVTLPKA